MKRGGCTPSHRGLRLRSPPYEITMIVCTGEPTEDDLGLGHQRAIPITRPHIEHDEPALRSPAVITVAERGQLRTPQERFHHVRLVTDSAGKLVGISDAARLCSPTRRAPPALM